MMEPVIRVIHDSPSPLEGEIRYDWPKMAWNLGMISCALMFAPVTFSLDAVLLCLVMTYTSLLIGHSIGMHRMMIHRAFKTSTLLRRILIYIGVLVGMSGPFGIIAIHDMRDWAQRKNQCHGFFSHKRHYLRDIWWQLTCKFVFKHPPTLQIEPMLNDDKFLVFCEKTWRWHQLLLASLLFAWGGWAYVIWGVCVRVSISVVGHWTITYFCHNPGVQTWRVKGAAVQASNLKHLGILTYGECWHNNHHAFPESAQIGLDKGQWDPAWWCIQALQKMGLVYDVVLPRAAEKRSDLSKL